MMRWIVLVLCSLSLPCTNAMAEPTRAVVAVLAGDAPTLDTLSAELIAARDRIGLKENQVLISRVLTQRWKTVNYKGLGIKNSDLPMVALARLNAQGKVVSLIGYPDFAERAVAQPKASAERLLRHWAETSSVVVQPVLPLIRAATLSPEPTHPFPIGAEILVTVQAAGSGIMQVNSASNHTVTLPEVGGGLYQGKYVVAEDEQGDVALMAHFVGSQGEVADYPIGVFKAVGWVPPSFVSLNPLGGDVYQVRGTAPPGSIVKVKCHIDMGRFLFVGYPDYDAEWNVQTESNGQFTFNMDLNQSETRRNGELDAQFTAYAEHPTKPEQRTEEIQYTGKVRMINYTRNSASYYGNYGYGPGYGWSRPGFTFGLGYPGWGYGRRGFGRCW
jgi:hypothetical protein